MSLVREVPYLLIFQVQLDWPRAITGHCLITGSRVLYILGPIPPPWVHLPVRHALALGATPAARHARLGVEWPMRLKGSYSPNNIEAWSQARASLRPI